MTMTKQARGWDEIRARLAAQVQPEPQALTFTGIPLDYWRQEIALNCRVSIDRLARICAERGADYEKTIAGLR